MPIDLHLHSTASDGEHPPDEVVRRARAAGLTIIALTDHDTLAGVPRARRAAESVDLSVICGCEFSVAVAWGELHLLGYFLPDADPTIDGFLEQQRLGRTERAREIVHRLNGLGVEVTEHDVLTVADGGAVGRPHVAQALMARGAVESISDAFDRYIGWNRPAFVEKNLPPVETVTALVRVAGGVTSAAHLKDRATKAGARALKDAGVDALEAIHPAHDPATVERIKRLADANDLLLSGGSDWHGKRVDPVARAPLGSIKIPEAWLKAMEELTARNRP